MDFRRFLNGREIFPGHAGSNVYRVPHVAQGLLDIACKSGACVPAHTHSAKIEDQKPSPKLSLEQRQETNATRHME